jgi:hypothetical protein
MVAFGLTSGCALNTGAGESTEETADATQEVRGRHRPDFRILNPESRVRGKTFEQWAGEWWGWIYETPASTHPALDTTGEFCHENQPGPVMFLAGTFGGAVNRTCTIRHNKPVLFPLITFQADNCGIPPEDQLTRDELIDVVEAWPNTVTALSLEVDGIEIGSNKDDLSEFLTDTAEFSYVVPAEDSLYELFGLDFEGPCSPSFTRGYFVALSLDRGEHTLHFTGALDNGFAIDTSYELTVR